MSPSSMTQRGLKSASIAIPLVFLLLSIYTPMSVSAESAPAGGAPLESKASQKTPTIAPDAVPEGQPPARPMRSVSLITPKVEMWPDQIEAQGNIMPWQETRVGTEIGGLRLVSVLANVGDVVKKGQVLARLNPAPVEADLEVVNAQLMETQAALAQAVATLDRAKRLAPSGGVSQQELTLYETQKQTAEARVNAARAQGKTQRLRLESATLTAPDDGIISSRLAAEGAIVQAGSELFRLIRQGRLEWRAEVKGETLLKLSVGQDVMIKNPYGPDVKGRVRQLSPTIDLTTRNGLAYVDLPLDTNLKAGLFLSGTLAISKRKALVLPSSAVLSEGGTNRVFKVNADNRVEAVEVQLGRVKDDHVEISSGLDGKEHIVARDPDLLKNGDQVDVKKADGEKKLTQASIASLTPGN